MRDSPYSDPTNATSGAIVWSLSRTSSVVWCRSADAWRRVRRWGFARAYAEAWRGGTLIACAFVIPTRKVRFSRHALGLPVADQPVSPRQRAYHAELRQRAAAGALFPRNGHERRSNADQIARSEAQP